MADCAPHTTIDPILRTRSVDKPRCFRPANLGGLALIALLTCGAYWPAIQGGFIMDDDGLLTESKLVKAPDGLARFWFTDDADDYWPLTNSSFWLEWRLWRGNSAGYHVTNLILHIAATLLIWAILERLALPGAFLAALLFALHPVNVESIAWIAQRKNALAMVFFLLSILWYLRAEVRRGANDERREKKAEETDGLTGLGRWYWLSLLAFLLAMLSKGSVAVLPVVLLVIAWWQRRRIGVHDLVRTAPFFLVAIGLAIVNVWFQTHGSGVVIRDAGFLQRLAGAGAAVWFYVSKAFLPLELLFVYPPWHIETGRLLWWLPLLAAVLVTALLWRASQTRHAAWSRPMLFAWLVFCVALTPVLGFSDVGFMQYSLVADHYEHIAIIAVAALVAAAWSLWRNRAHGSMHGAPSAAAAIVVATLALLTWRQTRYYGDPIALYEATLETNPTCWMAHNNLGLALVKAKRAPEAIEHYREAVRLKADYAEALNNWGAALNRIDQPKLAIERLQQALRLKPDFAMAHNNLGSAMELLGQLPEAIQQYQVAIEVQPDFAIAYYNLGRALDNSARAPDAMQNYRQALLLKPDFPEAEYFLALALQQQGKLPEAIEHFRQSLRLKADVPEVLNGFGAALSNAGQYQEAIAQLQAAVRLKPDFVEAHNNLGIALMQADRAADGIEQFQEALRLKLDFADAHLNLGAALGKAGRLQEGLEQFQEAIRLNPESVTAYTNMTRTYALLQRPRDAIAAAEKALNLAHSQGKTADANAIAAWLESYRTDQLNSSAPAPRSDSNRPVQRP